ncbi:MAG: hypothetical protein O3A00_02560 [Planctomycetota bacterium]|nr:hypothetical protein [Planctomycetota bacterium]
MSSDDAVKSNPNAGPPKKVFLVSYPKIVFMYPTFLASIIAGIYMCFVPDQDLTDAIKGVAERADVFYVTLAFLLILAMNLVVLSFDFPRTTSLTVFFAAVALGIGLWSLFRFNPDLVPWVTGWLGMLNPIANSTFYFIFAIFMCFIYVGVYIRVNFDYWEVRPNELLHHHGVLSDLERFPSPNLRIDKEINDIFEYILLRSGRMVLHPSNERRAIVLENVFFINRKEQDITRMLGAMQVTVRPDQHDED